MSDSEETLLLAEFSEGHSLRAIVDYLRNTNAAGPLVFAQDSITYTQSDPKFSVLNDLVIRTCDLTQYHLIHDTPLAFGVNMNMLRQALASVTTKESVRIISLADNPFLIIQRVTVGTDRSGDRNACMVRVQDIQPREFNVTGYRRTENEPNCTIKVRDFCKVCANIAKAKSDYISIHGSKSGISFQSLLDGGIAGSYHEFNSYQRNTEDDEEDSQNIHVRRLAEYLASFAMDSLPTETPSRPVVVVNPHDYGTIKVRTSHIKALGKLTNAFKEGTVKMYMEADLPLKLIFNNSFCRLTVYLKEEEVIH